MKWKVADSVGSARHSVWARVAEALLAAAGWNRLRGGGRGPAAIRWRGSAVKPPAAGAGDEPRRCLKRRR